MARDAQSRPAAYVERCRHTFYAAGLKRQQRCVKPKGHNGRCASFHAVERVR